MLNEEQLNAIEARAAKWKRDAAFSSGLRMLKQDHDALIAEVRRLREALEHIEGGQDCAEVKEAIAADALNFPEAKS